MENKLQPIVTKLLVQGEGENERTYVDFYIDSNKISGFYMPLDDDYDEDVEYDNETMGKQFISIIVDGLFFSVMKEDNVIDILTKKFDL